MQGNQETLPNTIRNEPLNESWKIALTKEIISNLLLTIFSGSVIAYFLSRLFIKSYLSGIGLNSETYLSFINTNTTSAFFLGIAFIFLSYIFTLSIPSIILRYIYNENLDLFQYFHSLCPHKTEFTNHSSVHSRTLIK